MPFIGKRNSARWYWITAASLFLVMMVNCGVGYYSFTLFVDPVAAEFHITAGDMAILYTFNSAGSLLSSLFLQRFLKRFSLRQIILLGGIASAIGYFEYALSPSLPCMFIGGVFIGASTVLSGAPAAHLGIAQWFDEKRSTVAGVVMAASGVGTAIGGPVIGRIIQIYGWRRAFVVIGILATFLVVGQVFFLFHSSPEDKQLVPYGAQLSEKTELKENEETGRSLYQVKSTLEFRVFVFALLAISLTFQVISLYQVPILLEKGYPQELTGMCLSVFALVDMTNKATAGLVTEKRGFKTVTLYCGIAVITAFCMVHFIAADGGAILFSALLGFWPSMLVLYGVSVAIKLYGKTHLSEFVGFSQTVLCFCSVLATPLIRKLYNAVNNFDIIIMLALFCTAVFLITTLCLLRTKKNSATY